VKEWGFFFTDRGGFNCSAYQYPRRVIATVAGEKKRYGVFFFNACSIVLKRLSGKNNVIIIRQAKNL
jgi:hypothetical protein